ncbi:MAG: SusC/RagA family TonB-linked outer membrane protein [Salinibacter sp.]
MALPLLLLFFLPTVAWGQTGTVEGQVVASQTGDPLPGVSVVVEGENIGAATDAQGNYVIESVPAGEVTLVASFVGYSTQRQTVQVEANQTVTVDFELASDRLGLDEVVVTGTGGQVEKRKLGNTISTVNAEDLEENPISNVSELLQGREPGVQSIPGSGMTGQGSQIRIRGSASLSQSNEPVVYIDGIRADNGGGFSGFVGAGGPATTSRLDDLNPSAIQRVEILKGAAAATLFGSEASNGVIQIFTKRGDAGQEPQFNLSVRQGLIQAPERRTPDQVGFAATQTQVDQMSKFYGGEDGVQQYELVGHSAIKDLLQTGYTQTYSGSVEGGTETITYFASGRFSTENGPVGIPSGLSGPASDEVTRAQGNINVGIFPSENSRLRVTARYNETDFSTIAAGNNIFGVLAVASGSNPRRVTEAQEYGGSFATLEETLQQTISQETQRFSGNVNGNYRPIEPLTLDATFGVDFTNTFGEEVTPFGWDVDGLVGSNTDGLRQIADTRNLELTLDTKAILDNQITDNITSSLTVGSQGFITRQTVVSVSGAGFPGPGFNVASAASRFDREETFREIVQIGLFAQEQVGINDFIFVTGGVRLDANSAFGDDFSTVTYPKVSASVVPSDADFWPSGGVGPVSSLRFRAALGQSGLQPGAFDALTTFGPLSPPGGSGIAPDNLGNNDLKPEISTEWEIGTEVGFLADRLTFNGTYWNRTVSDALVPRQFPPTGGFRASQLVNIGETKGQGVELGVNATPVSGQNLSVDVFANAAYLWEQVTDLGGAPPIKAAGSYPRVRNYVTEGFAPGAHFGASLMETPDNALPVDLNGDGEPDTKDQLRSLLDGPNPVISQLPANTTQVLLKQGGNPDLAAPLNNYKGKPWPDWSGSFGVDLSYGNFSLSTMFEYKFGNYFVNNLDGAFRKKNTAIGRNTPLAARVTRDFQTGGVDGSFNPQNSGQVRTQALETWLNELLGLAPFSGLNHIEPADNLRWRELSLTYNVPGSLVSTLGAEDLTLTLAGRNLYLWTHPDYTGQDPETNTFGRGGGDTFDNSFRAGIEAWNVPIPRRYSFEIRATF